jgi:cell division protein FtsL
MAQALRTVWLEPEQRQEPISPPLQPRRRKRAAAVRQSPLAILRLVGFVAIAVGIAVGYISSYARIAQYDCQRQVLEAQSQQLQQDCAQLRLDNARLENALRIEQVAKAQNLEFPTADRVHYIQVANDFPRTAVASVPPTAGHRTWVARAGKQMVASLGNIFQRLSRGPGSPAYAQD